MRLGLSSFSFPWAIGVPGYTPPRPLDAVGLLEKAAELGARLLQVCDNLPLHLLPEAELAAFERRANRLGVALEVGTHGIGPEQLRTYLRLAQRLHSPIVRTVTDAGAHRASEDEVVAALESLVPAFEQAGVTLAIENHGRQTAGELISILKRLDSPAAGICLDTTNSFGSLESPDQVVEALAPYAVNLHLKDFTIRRLSHQFGYIIEGAPLGQGRLDVPWVLELLHTTRKGSAPASAGGDCSAIIELWTPPEETLAATIAKQDDWARQSVAYLRQFVTE